MRDPRAQPATPAASLMSTAKAIIRKDLAIEWRTKESVPAMALFTVTVYVLFHFGLDRDSLDGELASGVLWVTLLLAAARATLHTPSCCCWTSRAPRSTPAAASCWSR